jgi:hypothetical protein
MMNNYKILNISPGSSQDEIKKAYRKLILKYHPDKLSPERRTKGAEERFIKIKEAYENLTKTESKPKPRSKPKSKPKPKPKSKPKSSKADYLNKIYNDFIYVPYDQQAERVKIWTRLANKSIPTEEELKRKSKEASRAIQDAVFKYHVRSH